MNARLPATMNWPEAAFGIATLAALVLIVWATVRS